MPSPLPMHPSLRVRRGADLWSTSIHPEFVRRKCYMTDGTDATTASLGGGTGFCTTSPKCLDFSMFCRLKPGSHGERGHAKAGGIPYFGTLHNTFSFYIGCSDWHHAVFLLSTKGRWDSLSSADQALLRDKYPDAGEGTVCEFCVRSARPSAFFSRRSSGSSSTGPQSVDSGL